MEPLSIYLKNELRLLYQHGNPAMSLSVEEAIARTGIPTFRVWTTSKCVVVGRFQDTEKEVDTIFCQQQGIAVLRRFTGGGAVLLDEGVACLSFCLPIQKNPLDIFRALSMCVGETINASIDDKNSLFIDNKKVSGAASCKKWGSLFHHMTVLVGCNLDFMKALTPHKGQGNTASNFYEVANIPMNMKAILFKLAKNVEALLDCDLKPGKLEQKELDLAERLLKEKYTQTEWNFQGIDPW
jgi:lipoate-protein ligase A